MRQCLKNNNDLSIIFVGCLQRLLYFIRRFGNSMSTIFWTIFGLIDEDSFQIDVSGYGAIWKTGTTLFAAYNIIIVIVAINMLIAILNESYTRITVRCHLKSVGTIL